MTDTLGIIIFIIILLYSIILHEIAHGYAAYRNGDNTAYNAGRLTLNPFSHLDLFGSILVPIISYLTFKIPFGWAKPVPYVPDNLNKNNKFAELEVASAGILTNFLLALLSVGLFYLLRFLGVMNGGIEAILQLAVSINVFLGLFNLLPFPPADGFSIFSELWLFLSRNKSRNTIFRIRHTFSNPIMMIAVIFVAVNVFSYIVPYIMSFISWIFSF